MIRIIVGLIASVAAMLVALGMLAVLVPLYAADIGFDAVTIGWIASIYYLGYIAGPWLAPPLVACAGARAAFVLAAAVALAGVAAMPFLAHPIAWAALRFVSGMGLSILYILIEAGLNARSGNAGRGRLLSAYLIVSQGALVAGQALVGLIGVRAALPFLIAAAMIALAAAIHSTIPHPAAPPAAARLRPVRLFRAAPAAALGTILFGMTEAIFLALGPLFARAAGFGVGAVATFMAAHMIGGAISQWPMGALSDRIDRRIVILFGAAGSVAATLWLAAPAAPGFGTAVACSCLLGAFLLPLYGLLVALAHDGAEPGERVALSSGLVLAYAIGAAGGPPAVAALMATGARALPLSAAFVQALLVGTMLVALRKRHPVAAPS